MTIESDRDADPRDDDTARHDGPPPYEATAVGRVVARVEIDNIELIHAHFERDDDQVLPDSDQVSAWGDNDIFVDVEPELAGAGLGVICRFGVESQAPALRIFAFFRLTYSVSDGPPLDAEDVTQFAHWNALFNAWPYFREYVSSTINRAGFPRLVLPVMRVPRADSTRDPDGHT